MLFTQFQLSEWQTGMSAFGKRGGMGGGGRPNFGVAKPMKGGPKGAASIPGGDQFPPIDELTPPADAPVAETGANGSMGAAMDRLTARQNASGDQSSSKVEGFEASVHRIKEQVLPRLLERVDPEAAATLNKDELAEEFRPIISEVLAELKITLNRREQFALEKVLVDELLGLGPLEELLADPAVSDIMVNGPEQTYVERKGKLEIAQEIVIRKDFSRALDLTAQDGGRTPGPAGLYTLQERAQKCLIAAVQRHRIGDEDVHVGRRRTAVLLSHTVIVVR